MKIAKYFVFFFAIPVVYFMFRNKLIEQWNSIESFIAILSYWTSLLFYSYNSDIRLHFFVNRLVSVFRYDHTTWIFSSKYNTLKSKAEVIKLVESKFASGKNIIKTKTDNSLELLINNNFLLKLSFQSEYDYGIVFLNTSKIIVPTREISRMSSQIIEILEGIENAVQPQDGQVKDYNIDIEYRDKSPYYSYWIKKLPEEMIFNFNCNLSLPNKTDSKIKVNKNHLIISSNSYSKIFELTKDYVSLQAMI